MTRVVRGFQQRRRAFLIGLLAGLVCAAVWLVAVGTSAEAQGVSGYTEVTGAAVTVPGFTSATGSATCPTGDVVVSGGYTLVGGNMEIDISAPLDAKGTISSTTWTVTGFDNGDGQGTFTPYAICVSSSTAGYSEASKAQSVNGVSSAQLTETCPAASVITGGGFGFAAANTALMVNESDPTSSSTVSKTTWTVFVANSARTTQSLTTYVVCVSDTISGYSEQLAQGSAAGVMSATCPSGSLVIGGGVFAPGPPNTSVDAPVVQNAAGAFVVSNSSWSVDAASTGGGVIGSIAICAAPAPTVNSLKPSNGPAAGGNMIAVVGSNFIGATAVNFGSTPATSFSVVSSVQINAVVPAGSGAVDVTVATPGGTSPTVSGDVYKYVPSVTSVSPTSGPTTGGTTVTINGTGFTGATGVSFGGTAATFSVKSSSQISATAPTGVAGTVDITVTTPGGTSTTSTNDQYTYVTPPTVTRVSPSSGPAAGGTSVTIAGTNFTGATAVSFGGTPASTFTVTSAGSITATSPAGSGAVDVTVTIPGGGTSATNSSDVFKYVPSVTSVSPASGPTGGGTSVTINGTGFTGATAVSFGGTAASSYTVNSSSKITAIAPAEPAGIVDITVTTPSATSTTSTADQFTYQAPPTVTISSPTNSQSYSLNQVVATSFSCTEGANGPGIQSCTDSNGATNGTGTLNTSNIGAHTYTVTAVSQDGQGATKSINYTVIGPPTATITAPANNQTYNLNQSVSTSFSCSDSINGPGIQTCTDSNGATGGTGALDTSTAGPHTYTVTATSQDGQTAAKSINYTVAAPPTAAITAPANNQTYAVNQAVATMFSCTEGASGPGIQTCADNHGTSGTTGTLHGTLDTSTTGAQTYTVTATSGDGQTAAKSINYTVAAPPTTAITAPANNQTYAVNQAVATTFSCTEGTSGPGIQTCADNHGTSGTTGTLHGTLDSSTTGTHTYTVTATSQDGQTATKSISYTVAAQPTTTITAPANNQTYAVNQAVPTTFSCTEGTSGPGINTCADNHGTSGTTGTLHGTLDTSTTGAHTYTVTATSADGQTGTATINYTVAAQPTATITAPANNQTYNLNQAVSTTFSCAEGASGPGIQTCADNHGTGGTTGTLHGTLDTSTAGLHTYTVTATSQDTQSTTTTISYTVRGAPTATITAPADNQTYNLNQAVTTTFSCTEGVSGPGIQTCADNHGTSGTTGTLHGTLDTSTSGPHTYKVTATSQDGQTATTTISYTVGAPPTATITAPANNQTYNLNQVVATTFSCTRGAGGGPIQTCVDSNGFTNGTGTLDTSIAGAHTYKVTATSQDTQTATTTINYTVIGPPTATIAAPADNQNYAFNQPVSTAYNCAEATNGPGIQACRDSGGATNGAGTLDTSTAGAHTYTVTATSKDGQSATATIHYTVAGPVPPTVAGGAPTNQTSSGATPAGTVNPEGMPTQAYFEYGLDVSERGPGASTTLYDQSTTPQAVGSDSANHTVSVPLAGLIPGALYHVRLVAVNAAGTTFGPDQTFTTAQSAPPPPPVIGQSEDVQPVSGKVFIKNREGQFVPLTGATQIASGSVIDATHGSLEVTAAVGKHKTERGTFGGAIFKLTQAKTGLTTLSLLEAAFKGAPSFALCNVHKKAGDASAAALSSKTLQLLHANAHGKFTTQGKYSAATVRGTKWTIADRCDGTLTHDITDSVAVTDFVRHKTLILHAGQSYLAAARNLGRRGS